MRTLVVLALLSSALAGCATVRPWERGRLAAWCMELDEPNATASYDAHVRAVRVGDLRPSGVGGGGCGCN